MDKNSNSGDNFVKTLSFAKDYRNLLWIGAVFLGAFMLLSYSHYENTNFTSADSASISFIAMYAFVVYFSFYIVSGLFTFPSTIRSTAEDYLKDKMPSLFDTENHKTTPSTIIRWIFILFPTIFFIIFILMMIIFEVMDISFFEDIDIVVLLLIAMLMSTLLGCSINFLTNIKKIGHWSTLVLATVAINIANMLFVSLQLVTIASPFIHASEDKYDYILYLILLAVSVIAINIILFVRKFEFFSMTAFISVIFMFEIMLFFGPGIVGGKVLNMMGIGGRIPIEVVSKNGDSRKLCLLLNRGSSITVREITESKKCILGKKYVFTDNETIYMSDGKFWRALGN